MTSDPIADMLTRIRNALTARHAKVEKTKGMNISITTTARTDAEGVALLRQMGMPFRQ